MKTFTNRSSGAERHVSEGSLARKHGSTVQGRRFAYERRCKLRSLSRAHRQACQCLRASFPVDVRHPRIRCVESLADGDTMTKNRYAGYKQLSKDIFRIAALLMEVSKSGNKE